MRFPIAFGRLMRVFIFVSLLILNVQAQGFEFLPGARYDASIPTLKSIAGHDFGERITMHHEMERYIHALEQSARNRVRVHKYAETWEGKPLYYLIIGSPANINRLDAIRNGIQKLADPRQTTEVEANELIRTLPSIVWLICGVHGNEISSVDAGLLTAYHLLAAQNDDLVNGAFANSLVIIDPMQNPDGRDRFINYFRQNTGRWHDADLQSAEHNEVWPSGRVNHYLFDMNRDWFAQTQLETRGRTRAFLEWFPQVFADLHEMGTESTYYFAPPALPYNPNITSAQHEWLRSFGRNNGKWFDRFGFDYFTRENYDSFYPGYGEGWPMFHGSIGMTYEQASVRGMIAQRRDETRLHYRDSVRHHFIAALSTVEHTANNREQLLKYFYEYRRTAIEEGRREAVKEYIIAPGADPNRAARLASWLMASGIEVKRATAPFNNARTRDYYEETLQSREFPAGTFVVTLAQPAKRLARTLMDKRTEQDKEFIDEQREKNRKRQPEEFYDVTAWSLPFLFDAQCYTAETASSGQFAQLKEPPKPEGKVEGGPAALAYLIPWGTQSAASALADLFRQDIRVHSTDKQFKQNGVNYPAGTLIVKVKDNPSDLFDRMKRLSSEHGVNIRATESAWVEEGPNFGSANVNFLVKPKIALAYNTPTSPNSAGWVRYLIEQRFGYPVTTIRAEQLRSADLSRYNVLILPDSFAGYGSVFNDGNKLREWMAQGGTLISFANATTWLTDERINLLPTKRERRDKGEVKSDKPSEAPAQAKPASRAGDAAQQGAPPSPDAKDQQTDKALEPKEEWPSQTPGAILRASVDREHWLGFGYGATVPVLVDSNRIFTPLRLDQGVNIVRYLPEDKFYLSGLMWDDARKQIPNKSYLMYVRIGRGHLVSFAEDPGYRAFLEGLHVMLMNAVLLGPGH
ncbi:MAG: peptidase M14 [Acidobacteria bacterium]|nr:peptidase M14 [Acidobacteriota bacterium]